MTQILFSLTIGCLLLALVLFWFWQGSASHKLNVSEARNALTVLQIRLLPINLMDRVLDYNDFLFVQKQRAPHVLELLETERKTIVLYWLSHTRQQVKLLMSFHIKSARYIAKLAPAQEFKLALNYLTFLLACDVLRGLIWILGPFRVSKVARYTVFVAARFCAASEQILMITKDPHTERQQVPRNA